MVRVQTGDVKWMVEGYSLQKRLMLDSRVVDVRILSHACPATHRWARHAYGEPNRVQQFLPIRPLRH
jgi:hypothetical protein